MMQELCVGNSVELTYNSRIIKGVITKVNDKEIILEKENGTYKIDIDTITRVVKE